MKGIITDESDNGNITYIEPNETVFINNELTELYLDERREIHKILVSVTATIRPHKETIEQLQQLMAALDVIRAKAYFAVNFKFPTSNFKRTSRLFKRIYPSCIVLSSSKQHKPIIDNTVLLDTKIVYW